VRVWKSTVAGIIDLIAGIKGITGSIFLLALGHGLDLGTFDRWGGPFPGLLRGGFFHALAIPILLFGIVAIIGGIFALQRRSWGWALAGGIAAVFASPFLGVVAIIFTALSQNEFAAGGGISTPSDRRPA
jgi:hypothetical protein